MATGVAPVAGDVSVQRDGSEVHEITVTNNEDASITYDVDVLNVEFGETQGSFSLIELSEPERKWIGLGAGRFTLEPGEIRTIELAISPSSDVESHARVLGVRILEESGGTSGVTISGGVISLVFVQVGDDVLEDVSVLDVSASHAFATELPIQFMITFRNDGERVVQPSGTVEIRNMLGETVKILELNIENKRVLENQIRTFIAQWGGDGEHLLTGGVYTATVRVTPWTGGEEFTEELTVFVIPWRTIALLSTLLILIFLIIKYSKVVNSEL